MSKSKHRLSTLAIALHLSCISLASVAISSMSTLAKAESKPNTQLYKIAPNALSSVLNQFAAQADILLVVDARQLHGLNSAGLTGEFDVTEGLNRILAASGYSAVNTASGYILVEAQQTNPGSALATAATQSSSDTQQIVIDQPTQLSPITVEATEGSKDWAYRQSRAVSVIGRDSIDRRFVQHISDILQDTPGVYSAVNRHNPALSVNIRGMQDFGRVNMMVDGMRQNHVEIGHQQRNGQMYIDSEFIADAIIEKGPRSGVHGATAIAGSANFRTLSFEDIIMEGKDQGGGG
jgi:heme acquisition protein HasR